MDIQEQIDQFLQIPEIKEIFSDHDIHWHVGEYSQGWYFDFSVPDYEKGFFLCAWNAWQAVKSQAVPEGFVLVPKKPDVDKAWDIALKRIVPPPKTNDAIQQELMCKKYVDDLCSEQDRILLDYEAMIEVQEQKG